jgi:hypothetical protein
MDLFSFEDYQIALDDAAQTGAPFADATLSGIAPDPEPALDWGAPDADVPTLDLRHEDETAVADAIDAARDAIDQARSLTVAIISRVVEFIELPEQDPLDFLYGVRALQAVANDPHAVVIGGHWLATEEIETALDTAERRETAARAGAGDTFSFGGPAVDAADIEVADAWADATSQIANALTHIIDGLLSAVHAGEADDPELLLEFRARLIAEKAELFQASLAIRLAVDQARPDLLTT